MIFKILTTTLLLFSSLSQGGGNLPGTGNDYAISPSQIQRDSSVIISERSLNGRRLLEKSFGKEVNVRFQSPSSLSQEDIVQRLDGDYVASDDEKILNNDSNANNNSSAEPCPDNSWLYAVSSVLGLLGLISCTVNCYQYKKNVTIKRQYNLVVNKKIQINNVDRITVNNTPSSQQNNANPLCDAENDAEQTASSMLSGVIEKKKGKSTEIEKKQNSGESVSDGSIALYLKQDIKDHETFLATNEASDIVEEKTEFFDVTMNKERSLFQ